MLKLNKIIKSLLGINTSESNSPMLMILAYFIFFSLFITLRVLIFGPDTSASLPEYIFSALPDLLILLILFLLMLKTDLKLFYKQLSLFDKIVALYILTNVAYGTILAHDLKLSIYAIRMTYLPMLFYFIARLWSTSDANNYQKLVHNIVLWNVAYAVIGLLIYFVFTDFFDYMMLRGHYVEKEYFIRRMGSLFWTPVVYASFLTVSGLYCYYMALQKGKWFYYVLFAVFWSCLFLTVTRGAIISFLFGLIVLAIFLRNWRGFVISILIMAFVIFCFWMLGQVVTNILAFIFDSTWDTLSMKRGMTRVELWIHAWNDFLRRPMGFGLGKAGHVAARFYGLYSKDAATFCTDGWYLKLLNETGVWGMFSYLLMSVIYFVQSVRYLKNNKAGFYLFLFVIILVVAVQNIVSNVNDFYLFACLIWLIIGISQNIYLKWRYETT